MPSKPKQKSRDQSLRQYGAIPYRIVDGSVRVLLVTSRESGRYVLPKGNPMKGRKPYRAAAIEAYEEGGVKGRVAHKSVGSFASTKAVGRRCLPCIIRLYPLKVKKVLQTWPEAGQRTRTWVDLDLAADMVLEPGLAAILRAFRPPSALAA